MFIFIEAWNVWIDVREDIDDSLTVPVAIAFLNSTTSSFIASLVRESLDIPFKRKQFEQWR